MGKFKFILVTCVVFFAFGFISSPDNWDSSTPKVIPTVQDTNWVVPEAANALVNPMEVDEFALLEATDIYKQHCRSCHGRLGDGKGAGAAEVSTPVTDFTLAEFHEQSDGSMFWKISEGRNDMKPFKGKLSEEEIWLTVIFIKDFAPKE